MNSNESRLSCCCSFMLVFLCMCACVCVPRILKSDHGLDGFTAVKSSVAALFLQRTNDDGVCSTLTYIPMPFNANTLAMLLLFSRALSSPGGAHY